MSSTPQSGLKRQHLEFLINDEDVQNTFKYATNNSGA